MKKLLLAIALVFSFSIGYSQIRDSMIWYKMDRTRLVPKQFKTTVAPLRSMVSHPRPTSGYRDTLIWYMDDMEKSIMTGKAGNALESNTVQQARKLYPGKTTEAIRKRLIFYGKQMKGK